MTLPPGWATVSLGDIAQEVRNGISAKPDASTGVPILRISAVRPMRLNSDDVRCLEPAAEWASYRLAVGDLLFTRYNGNPSLVGACALVRESDLDGRHGLVYPDKLIRVRTNLELATPGFVERAAHSESARAFILGKSKTSAGQVGVSGSDLKALPIALPPLNEQRRIVAKLDVIFEQTRAAKARLERLPALLDKLKRSILAAAFRGDLTADWRAAHADIEPGSLLLDRIRSERRARWEGALRGKGKDTAKTKYDEPETVDEINLPELPVGWVWCRLDEVILNSLYGPRFGADDYAEQGVPTIRTTDLGHDGRIHLRDPPLIAEQAANLGEWGLQDGDLVVTRTGATIGKAAVYSSDIGPALPSAYLIRFRPVLHALGRWLHLFLISPRGQTLLGTGATATAQPNVNARTIGAFVVPLPPLQEQAQILAAVDAAIKLAESVSHRVEGCAVATSSLERAALAKAFRGELVGQDRNDEPAADLLARIRATVATDEPSGRHGRARNAPDTKTRSTITAKAAKTAARPKTRASATESR